MNNKLMYLLGLLICLSFAACDDDEMTPPEPANPFEGCCGTEGLETQINSTKFYIPNLFTPNGDGINDLFVIHGGFDDRSKVVDLKIFDQDDFLMFQASEIPTNDVQFYWSGRIGNTDSIYQGLFNYTAILSDDTTEMEVMGTACSYICKSAIDQFPNANSEDCMFSAQHDGGGGFDPFVPSNEDECF